MSSLQNVDIYVTLLQFKMASWVRGIQTSGTKDGKFSENLFA